MSIGALSGGGFDFSSLRAQFEQARAAAFEQADADKSGGLSLQELESARAESPFGGANSAGSPSTEEIFAQLDADGNGEVSSTEFTSARPPTPAGGFSPEAFASLLSAQESEGSTSILDLFAASSEEEVSEETDLIGSLLDALEEDEES